MPEFVAFSIAQNLEKDWTLRHREIQDLPRLFKSGMRQIRNVMFSCESGCVFPLDLNLDSCTEPEVLPIRFTGRVHQKDNDFRVDGFIAEVAQDNASIIFFKEPSR